MSRVTPATFERIEGRSAGRPLFVVRGATGDGFRLHIGYEGSGLSVHVKEGFVTDLASDPTGIMQLTGAGWLARYAVTIHDRLCEDTLYTRLEADAILLIAMEATGVPVIWRELIFAAVRTNTSRARRNLDELVFDVVMPPY